MAEVFDVDSDLCRSLFIGRKAEANRLSTFREQPIEVIPGVMSNDAAFLAFKDSLSRRLTDSFPETVDEDGRVSGNGVRSNFYGIRHVSGFPMLPATYPLTSNEYLREQADLVNAFSSEIDENFFRAFVRLFFSGLEPSAIPVKKNSSSVLPFCTKDQNEKESLMRFALDSGQKAGELMLGGDYETAWKQFYIGGAYFVVYRQQASDKVTLEEDGSFSAKDRPVADLEFAQTGGREGSFSPASKRFGNEVDFRVPDGFFRARNRTAKGGPLGMNATLMPIAHAVRKHIYDAYAYTFHHTTRASTESDVRDLSYVIAADVSNHDWYWPHFILDVVKDELLNLGFADWWVELYVTKSRLPDFVTNVGPNSTNLLNGDYRAPSNSGGLPSGNAFTDIEGTLLMAFVYFLIQVKHTYPRLLREGRNVESATQVVHAYLRGELPIVLKNKSDDALLGWKDGALTPAARDLQQKMKDDEKISEYMIVSYEHGGAFLGSILHYPDSAEISNVVLTGNILSYVTNQFSPEYGIYSGRGDRSKAKRPYAGLAWNTMRENYGSCPIFDEVKDIIEWEWSKVYGESYDLMRKAWAYRDEKALADDIRNNTDTTLKAVSPVDVEVLIDPSRAEWKYAKDDVSDTVRSLLFKGIPTEDVEPFFNSVVNPIRNQ